MSLVFILLKVFTRLARKHGPKKVAVDSWARKLYSVIYSSKQEAISGFPSRGNFWVMTFGIYESAAPYAPACVCACVKWASESVSVCVCVCLYRWEREKEPYWIVLKLFFDFRLWMIQAFESNLQTEKKARIGKADRTKIEIVAFKV